LKDQFVKITERDMETKRILTSLAVKYIVAEEEADLLCAYMVKTETHGVRHGGYGFVRVWL
jgi:hypothetical protein